MDNNNKTMSIVGLVLGILVPVAGIIVSAIALKKIQETGDTENAGMAKAGLIIGIVLTVISVVTAVCSICTVCAAGIAAAGMLMAF